MIESELIYGFKLKKPNMWKIQTKPYMWKLQTKPNKQSKMQFMGGGEPEGTLFYICQVKQDIVKTF